MFRLSTCRKATTSFTDFLGTYIDDFLHAGDGVFQNKPELMWKKFALRQHQCDNVDFLRVIMQSIQKKSERVFQILRTQYVHRMKLGQLDALFDVFVSIWASFAWLADIRPDLCCALNRASRVTETSYSQRHIKELNSAISYSRSTVHFNFKYTILDMACVAFKGLHRCMFCLKR